MLSTKNNSYDHNEIPRLHSLQNIKTQYLDYGIRKGIFKKELFPHPSTPPPPPTTTVYMF